MELNNNQINIRTKQTITTLIIVILSSWLYGVIDYSLYPFEITSAEDAGRVSFPFLSPIIYYLLGALIACVPYLFTKRFRDNFNNITIVLALTMNILASLYDITNYYK